MVIERHVVADHRGLADDHAHAVVNEEAAADLGAGVDLDARDHAADVGHEAAEQAEAALPEPVRHVIEQQRVEARIAEEHLDPGADRRVAAEHAADVFPNSLEHGAAVRISMAGAERRRRTLYPCDGRDIEFPTQGVKYLRCAMLGRETWPPCVAGVGRAVILFSSVRSP